MLGWDTLWGSGLPRRSFSEPVALQRLTGAVRWVRSAERKQGRATRAAASVPCGCCEVSWGGWVWRWSRKTLLVVLRGKTGAYTLRLAAFWLFLPVLLGMMSAAQIQTTVLLVLFGDVQRDTSPCRALNCPCFH